MLWKFIDRPREDSLTAAVISHLLHLPSEVFWQILSSACFSEKFPNYPGEPKQIHAWPSWDASGTRNTARVIPDLIIEFDDFDLIIEAKRWDWSMQEREQWKNELIAYTNEYGAKKREVRMIALGGIHSHTDDLLEQNWPDVTGDNSVERKSHLFKCPVYMCQWSSVLLVCQRLKREWEATNVPSSRTFADVRILKDLTDLFIRHNIMPLSWFDDFDFQANRLSDSIDFDQQYFHTISSLFMRS